MSETEKKLFPSATIYSHFNLSLHTVGICDVKIRDSVKGLAALEQLCVKQEKALQHTHLQLPGKYWKVFGHGWASVMMNLIGIKAAGNYYASLWSYNFSIR